VRLSVLLGERQKERPSDAFLDSHIFLLRGGYIRQVAGGIFTLLPPAKRIARKIEDIIREEMDAVGGQEVLFPVVLPAELWQESGRYASVGEELVRFKDRAGRPMVLGMTHEEAAVHLARGEARSYLRYPFMIYQIQTKFRDEPRARGGLIRVREFTMKDGYSFHTSWEDLEDYYYRVYAAYERIFERVGLGRVPAVFADSGMMGGKKAHEFMFPTEGGEDTLVMCPKCGYGSNLEVAASVLPDMPDGDEAELPLEAVPTPGVRDIGSLSAFTGAPASRCVKAAVFGKDGGKPVVAFIRGDLAVNEVKLGRLVKSGIAAFAGEADGLCMGFIGPMGLCADAEVWFDNSLRGAKNTVCGANKKDFHFTGLSFDRDLRVPDGKFADIAQARKGDLCAVCGGPLDVTKGVELGHVFQLGDKYTKSMGMTCADETGGLKTPLMGCYGIGVGRLLACVAEKNRDANGPVWPASVAPWRVHICMLNADREDIRQAGERIYAECEARWDAVIDDRNAAAGVQFADADLLGAPARVILSRRNMDRGEAEIQTRDKRVVRTVKAGEAAEVIAGILGNGRSGVK